MTYPVLLPAIVLTSANNSIRFSEGVTTATAVIPAGTYYLRGNYTSNLIWPSEDFSVWTTSATVGAVPGYGVAPNGASSFMIYKITAATSQFITRAITSISATSTVSAFVRKATADLTDFNLYDTTANVDRHLVRIAWSSTGVPTLSTVSGSGTLFPPQNCGNGWWRIAFSVTGIVTGNANSLFLYPASTGPAEGSVEAWGVQVESGAAVRDYVKTTTASAVGPSDDFCLALKLAMESATASTNIYDIDVTRSISPSAPHTILTITRNAGFGSDVFGIQWPNALTTFDERLVGFSANSSGDFPPGGAFKTSTQACAASWVSNDIPREIEPVSERVVAVPRAASGRVQGVSRSARMQSWRMGLAFVDERRMLVDRGLTGPWDTLEGFLERFGAGAAFELHLADIASGTTLAPLSLATRVDAMHFAEDTLSGFSPTRLGPGVPLYSIDLRLHSRV